MICLVKKRKRKKERQQPSFNESVKVMHVARKGIFDPCWHFEIFMHFFNINAQFFLKIIDL